MGLFEQAIWEQLDVPRLVAESKINTNVYTLCGYRKLKKDAMVRVFKLPQSYVPNALTTWCHFVGIEN